MGEMAGYALDELMDIDEVQQRLAGVPFEDLDDMERDLLYDENGCKNPGVFDTWNPGSAVVLSGGKQIYADPETKWKQATETKKDQPMLTPEQRQEAFREQLMRSAMLWADSIPDVNAVKAGDVVAAAFDQFVAGEQELARTERQRVDNLKQDDPEFPF